MPSFDRHLDLAGRQARRVGGDRLGGDRLDGQGEPGGERRHHELAAADRRDQAEYVFTHEFPTSIPPLTLPTHPITHPPHPHSPPPPTPKSARSPPSASPSSPPPRGHRPPRLPLGPAGPDLGHPVQRRRPGRARRRDRPGSEAAARRGRPDPHGRPPPGRAVRGRRGLRPPRGGCPPHPPEGVRSGPVVVRGLPPPPRPRFEPLRPRPRHPKASAEAQASFQKSSPPVAEVAPPAPGAVEVWFETRPVRQRRYTCAREPPRPSRAFTSTSYRVCPHRASFAPSSPCASFLPVPPSPPPRVLTPTTPHPHPPLTSPFTLPSPYPVERLWLYLRRPWSNRTSPTWPRWRRPPSPVAGHRPPPEKVRTICRSGFLVIGAREGFSSRRAARASAARSSLQLPAEPEGRAYLGR